MTEWLNRPLERVYAAAFIDAIVVKIRDGQSPTGPSTPRSASPSTATRDPRAVGQQRWGGAKFWLQVLTELKNRGTDDVCIVVCDGLTGLPDAVAATWPLAVVQVLHLIRNTFRLARQPA